MPWKNQGGGPWGSGPRGPWGSGPRRPWGQTPATPERATMPSGLRLDEMERRLIEATLERFSGHRARTAEALGIGIRTLSGKLKEYGYTPRSKPLAKAA